MEWFKQIWDQLSSLLRWWVTVLPWEQGVKVWCGNQYKIIGPGLHFRVPYFHTVYVQSVRTNFVITSPQTLTTACGKTLTLAMVVGYAITDIVMVYNSVSELTAAITSMVMSSVSAFVSENRAEDCGPKSIEGHVKNVLIESKWGIC